MDFRLKEEVLESVSFIKRAACTDPMHGRFVLGDKQNVMGKCIVRFMISIVISDA